MAVDALETRELRYFVAVAEELHIGRAAERPGMAQPPLSRAIQQLERRLDVCLLERNRRGVALTDAGEMLLNEGRATPDAATAAARRTRRAGRAGRAGGARKTLSLADISDIPDLPPARWPRHGAYPTGPGPEIRNQTQLAQLVALGRTVAVLPESAGAWLPWSAATWVRTRRGRMPCSTGTRSPFTASAACGKPQPNSSRSQNSGPLLAEPRARKSRKPGGGMPPRSRGATRRSRRTRAAHDHVHAGHTEDNDQSGMMQSVTAQASKVSALPPEHGIPACRAPAGSQERGRDGVIRADGLRGT